MSPDARRAPSPPTAGPAPVAPRPLGPAGRLLLLPGMLLWVGAFLPEPVAWATVPGLLCYLALVEGSGRLREALLWTVVLGALAVGAGYHWMAETVQRFGGLPASVAWLAAALFGVAGTVHGLLFVLVHRALRRHGRRPHPLVVAATIVFVESLPLRFFPWLVGHGAVDVPPLRQLAEWGGVPLVSFALLALIVPLREAWVWARRDPAARPGAGLAALGVGLALFLLGWWRFEEVRDADARAPRHLRVAIVQADVGAFDKRAEENARARATLVSVERYAAGSRRAAEAGAELIVWPETAVASGIPFLLPRPEPGRTLGALAHRGHEVIRDLGADHAFLIGAYESIPTRQRRLTGELVDERYNVAALRARGDRNAPWSVYRKVHLIPFGETMPIGLSHDLLPQGFTMRAGTLPQPLLRLDGLTIAPFICYEAILPEHVRALCAGARPDLLANLTNDSWFTSWEPYQHLNFSRFRCVEHRAPMVRATNTGVSAFVDATGEVVKRLGVGEEGVLVHDVPLAAHPPTLYARTGNLFPWLMGAWVLLALLASAWRGPRA